VPADETLASGEFERFSEARQFLKAGERALKAHDAESGLDFAEKAEALNPGFYGNSSLAGRALLALGRRDEAAQAFGRALAEQPAFAKERQELEELLREARAAN
jgi:tetratricopeptide (TPR) repeat protein